MTIASESKRLEELNEQKRMHTAQEKYLLSKGQKNLTKMAEGDSGLREEQQERINDENRATSEQLGVVDESERLRLDVDFMRLADYFDIQPTDLDYSRKTVDFLRSWALENVRNKDIVGVLTYLKKVQKDLGFKEKGFTAIKKLYQYARLDMDKKRIERETRLLKE